MVRSRLFGGWEGNWIAWNTAHDVTLPEPTKGGKLGFLMYPGGNRAGPANASTPDTFKYPITRREITA